MTLIDLFCSNLHWYTTHNSVCKTIHNRWKLELLFSKCYSNTTIPWLVPNLQLLQSTVGICDLHSHTDILLSNVSSNYINHAGLTNNLLSTATVAVTSSDSGRLSCTFLSGFTDSAHCRLQYGTDPTYMNLPYSAESNETGRYVINCHL